MNDEYQNKLQCYYDEIVKGIYPKDFRFYSLRSIRNFIFHFDKLIDEDKSEAYLRIKDYLDLVKNTNPAEIRNNSQALYNEIIYSIVSDYYFRLGFVPYARWIVVYVMYGAIFLMLFLIGIPAIYYTIILLAFIIHHCWILNKKAQNKVFGLRY